MAMRLDAIVPWGRSRSEYEAMFLLDAETLSGRLLDCGAGPASFTAEAAEETALITALDPIYAFRPDQIRTRFEESVDTVIQQVKRTPADWVWSFHPGPDELASHRRRTLERFLADFESHPDRYRVGELPNLPFPNATFDLALCSHLLFLYSDLLGLEFHTASLLELARVAREVRVFPLLNLDGRPSGHLPGILHWLPTQGLMGEVVRVPYELQRGGNTLLRITRSGPGHTPT